MDTETLTVLPKGEDFEIIIHHDQSGSVYGITLSKNAYEQLRQHFVSGQFPPNAITDKEHKYLMKELYPKDNSKSFRR